MPQYNLLIIEDDLSLATFIRLSLETQGYQTSLALTGSDGLKQLNQTAVDLVLLDVDLPDLNGIEICKQIRAHWSCPILFFSAEMDVETKIRALDAGANDYIVKPVDVRELLARVNAQLRNLNHTRPSKKIGQLQYQREKKSFFCGDHPLTLSEIEHRLLTELFEESPEILSKADLYKRVWQGTYDPHRDAHLLETNLSRLRTRLKSVPSFCQIQNVYGKGYFLAKRDKE